MLIQLSPGVVCKKCDARIKLARDVPADMNLTLREDESIRDSDFELRMSCDECLTVHSATGFIRKGIFRGVHKYQMET